MVNNQFQACEWNDSFCFDLPYVVIRYSRVSFYVLPAQNPPIYDNRLENNRAIHDDVCG